MSNRERKIRTGYALISAKRSDDSSPIGQGRVILRRRREQALQHRNDRIKDHTSLSPSIRTNLELLAIRNVDIEVRNVRRRRSVEIHGS